MLFEFKMAWVHGGGTLLEFLKARRGSARRGKLNMEDICGWVWMLSGIIQSISLGDHKFFCLTVSKV